MEKSDSYPKVKKFVRAYDETIKNLFFGVSMVNINLKNTFVYGIMEDNFERSFTLFLIEI